MYVSVCLGAVALASFPDSTPKLFIAPCIKAFIHGAIKAWGSFYTRCDKKLGGGVWERGYRGVARMRELSGHARVVWNFF